MNIPSAESQIWNDIGAKVMHCVNQLTLSSPDLLFKDFNEQCTASEESFCMEASGRSALIVEIRRRFQECRLRYWIDRPGNTESVKEHLLARCALGFDSSWHQGHVFSGAVQYLSRQSPSPEAQRLVGLITVMIAADFDEKPNPGLADLLEFYRHLANST